TQHEASLAWRARD
ncbi:hypothetical protein BN1708_017616, partial [Verticillium longisporum]